MADRGRYERREVHITGQVQGVGFRYVTEALARRRAVTGYVENLVDGRVRLVIEGEPQEVDGLIRAVEQRMASYIEGVDVESGAATGEFPDFRIRLAP